MELILTNVTAESVLAEGPEVCYMIEVEAAHSPGPCFDRGTRVLDSIQIPTSLGRCLPAFGAMR
jgi:hypothetical protein